MGNEKLRWELKILGWEIYFYDGTQYCSAGIKIIPLGFNIVRLG